MLRAFGSLWLVKFALVSPLLLGGCASTVYVVAVEDPMIIGAQQTAVKSSYRIARQSLLPESAQPPAAKQPPGLPPPPDPPLDGPARDPRPARDFAPSNRTLVAPSPASQPDRRSPTDTGPVSADRVTESPAPADRRPMRPLSWPDDPPPSQNLPRQSTDDYQPSRPLFAPNEESLPETPEMARLRRLMQICVRC